jgi:hypothetical protein
VPTDSKSAPSVPIESKSPAPTRFEKGKGKQGGKNSRSKQPTSSKFVQDDTDDDVKADAPAPTTAPTTALPPTDHLKKNDPKCERCASMPRDCHANPNVTSATAACFECNFWKVRCSRVSGAEKQDGEAALKDDPDAPIRPKKSRSRKKPTTVPAGEPGQYGGELTCPFFPFSFAFF